MRRKEGFTLVELLIVLAVIAALLATITPVALNAVKRAKATQVAQNLRNIRTAVEQYVYTEQKLPTSINVLEGYLSKVPDGYGVVATPDSLDESGEATILVYYTPKDVPAEDVYRVYTEATDTNGISTDTAAEVSGTFTVGVEFTVQKYW